MKVNSVLFIILFILLISCTSPERKQKSSTILTYKPLPMKVVHPKNNLPNPAKIALGRLLFYDPILSGDKDVACASCHHPDFGYAEGIDLSIGVGGVGLSRNRKFASENHVPLVKRNSQTILNTGYNGIQNTYSYKPEHAPMFWDVRKNGLEEQALAPIESLEEMRGENFSELEIVAEVVKRLKNIEIYRVKFSKAFPNSPKVSRENMAKAIACFERSLITPNTRFDQYLRGDEAAMSEGEKEGFELFKKVGCVNCHTGPMLSDYKLHVLSVPENKKIMNVDFGVDSTFAFRTPSLRNLRYTAPYMHNGKFKSLEEVLEFYEDISNGHSENSNISNQLLDSLVKNISIKTKDMSLIISFFNTLNTIKFDKEIPSKVPSGLPVGGNIN